MQCVLSRGPIVNVKLTSKKNLLDTVILSDVEYIIKKVRWKLMRNIEIGYISLKLENNIKNGCQKAKNGTHKVQDIHGKVLKALGFLKSNPHVLVTKAEKY